MASVLQPVRETFRALAVTIVPEAAGLDRGGWADLERIVEDALTDRPAKTRRQLGLLIRLLDMLPLYRYHRRFTSLDPGRRTLVLRRVERSRLLLLRRGFWGLRTLVYMGYYARPAAAAAIGYRADPGGWDARRDSGDVATDNAAANDAAVVSDAVVNRAADADAAGTSSDARPSDGPVLP